MNRMPRVPVDSSKDLARLMNVQVVLRKLGRGSRAVAGRLVRAPRRGSVVVIEFSDGMHEYVTTPVKRVLRLASRDIFYIETVNSRYRLEVRDRERALFMQTKQHPRLLIAQVIDQDVVQPAIAHTLI